MAKSAVIQTRIDPDIKNKAQNIFNKLNISMSEAISIFLTQVTLKRGIPFEITLPNELTSDTLKKSEEGKNLHKVSSVDKLFRELDR
jgi:DNA-damage-inducible protein J